jgi:hypothetical protein
MFRAARGAEGAIAARRLCQRDGPEGQASVNKSKPHFARTLRRHSSMRGRRQESSPVSAVLVLSLCRSTAKQKDQSFLSMNNLRLKQALDLPRYLLSLFQPKSVGCSAAHAWLRGPGRPDTHVALLEYNALSRADYRRAYHRAQGPWGPWSLLQRYLLQRHLRSAQRLRPCCWIA